MSIKEKAIHFCVHFVIKMKAMKWGKSSTLAIATIVDV